MADYAKANPGKLTYGSPGAGTSLHIGMELISGHDNITRATTSVRVMRGGRGPGNAELWGGLAWLAFALWVAWEGYALGLGELREPGSGFAIFWAGAIAAGLALVVIAVGIARGGASVASLWAGTRWPKVVLVMALLLVFGFFFEWIGFIPAALVLVVVLMRFVELPLADSALWGDGRPRREGTLPLAVAGQKVRAGRPPRAWFSVSVSRTRQGRRGKCAREG